MPLTFDWPLDKSLSAVVYPKESKARIILEFLAERFRENQGYLSRHAVSDFASSVQSGKFLWHNAVFRASRKYVYMVVNDLIKMGMIQYRHGYVGSRLREGYFVEFTEFDKRLETIAKRWREYFQKKDL
jgi:hypothetical protein